ncbi:hypothetical protein K4K49_009366 [Colletotrichum sp. SAR 10_70]|nr:hypothetical protein K4K50_010834 [Colletotrichum sp. SAR 10_71]KAI8155314.1 hypothetical protein K4K49_009366 [Colletotrichum sp. SAR 10_70]KAI8214413.1 hypothetical protein K4K53_011186 [Colletotrichum sp. SAR 10_77]
MGSRGNITAKLENTFENLQKSEDRSANETKRDVANQNHAEKNADDIQDDESREYGESEGHKEQHRAQKVQRMEKSNTSTCSSCVDESSRSSYTDASDRNYDKICSADDGNHEPTEIENIEAFMNIQRHSSWGMVSDKSTRVEARGLKRARSQEKGNADEKHRSDGKKSRNIKKSKNGNQAEQRQVGDEMTHRRGDADEMDGGLENSPNGDNEVKESSSNDKIIQIMKFIRRMAPLPDERLMLNLQHGFPPHAQETILTGFRIIEWFQGTGSEMEDA